MKKCKLVLFSKCEVARVIDGIQQRKCAVPLNRDDERKTGICRFCCKGWESARNKFVSDSERDRALAA